MAASWSIQFTEGTRHGIKRKKNMVTEDDKKKKNQIVYDTEWVSATDQLPKCADIVKNTFLTGCSSNFV
jgi:hypothetical protein